MRSGIAAGWSHTERGRNRERRTLFFERFVEFVGHVEGLRDLIIFEDRVEPLSELDHLGRVAPSCLKLPQLRMTDRQIIWMGLDSAAPPRSLILGALSGNDRAYMLQT